MAAGGKPWAIILIVAVLSRLMSTDGRPLRLQQQLLERAGYQNPELDIDRTYELMNEKRDRRQHHSHQQLTSTANDDDGTGNVGKESRLGGGTRLLDQAVAAADEGPVAGVPPVHATAAVRNATKTAPVHSPEPKYHYEVHSVQHNPEKYATAEQKLRAVVRQAAAVEHQLRETDDGVRQTLIDDSEHHNQRLLAAKGNHVEKKEHSSFERHRLEQLRHLEDEKDITGPDDSDEDEEMFYAAANDDKFGPDTAAEDVKSVNKVAVQVRLDQNNAVVGEPARQAPASAGGDDVPAEHSAVEEKHRVEDMPIALPFQSAGGHHGDRSAIDVTRPASSIADIYFLAVVIGCSVAGIAGFLFAGLCWYRLQKKMKAASEVDYPGYGVTGPAPTSASANKGLPNSMAGSPGDRKLAQNAQLYHYQHQKQQMIAAERLGSDVNQHVGGTGSDVESEDENEDGDYTVFECPGLATNGEMEVRNPMFNDPTPVATPADTSGLYSHTKK